MRMPASGRHVVFAGEGRVEVRERPVPEPGRGELLLRVEAAGLCGSDRGAWRDGNGVTPGHETAGRVAAAGDGTSAAVGVLGAVFLVAYCGRCERCRAGSRGACLAKEGMLGFDRDGGLADFVLVPERCFLPVAGDRTAEEAVLLLDTTSTALHAARRGGAGDAPPPTAAIIGAGPLGLGCALVLGALGVGRVVSIDLMPYRLALAERIGAVPVRAGPDALRAATEAAGGRPALVIEASGSPAGQRLAVDLVGTGGRVVFVGHSPSTLEIGVSRDLIVRETGLVGSEYFDPAELLAAEALMEAGRVDPRVIATHRFGLDAVSAAYAAFWSGETGKVIVLPGGAR